MSGSLGLLKKKPPEPIDWGNASRESEHPTPRSTWAALVGALLIGIVLGYLGWRLQAPGGSVFEPALIVLGVGVVAAIAGAVLLAETTGRAGWFVLATGAMTLLASLWTWEFALPAAISWSNATSQAQEALIREAHEATKPNGARSQPCFTVTKGNIGPLNAPYLECATVSSRGKAEAVRFTGVSGQSAPTSGFTYLVAPYDGDLWFGDECSRHVLGPWWEFTSEGPPGQAFGVCPFGYSPNGGG